MSSSPKHFPSAYSPASAGSSDAQRHLQQELFDIQKRYEAWGLVIPFLSHDDVNVQFFGAHTVQVKIARDWDTFPVDNATSLRDLVLELTSHSIVSGKSKIILRKLFVAITSLALKIAPGSPSIWPDWIVSTIEFLSSRGTPTEILLDFLSIVAEEVETADLIGASKMQMQQTLLDAAPLVVQAVTSTLKCLQAWMSVLRGNDITPLVPMLISLLSPPTPDTDIDPEIFSPASDALQEIMTRSSLAGGAGVMSLALPLLVWVDTWGPRILQSSTSSGEASELSHSLCKLIVTLGDHSNTYFATNITSQQPVAGSPHTRSQLIQSFLRLLLGYTGLPGYFGVDEEESEMTLGFWYLFQESLWSVEYDEGDDETGSIPPANVEESNRLALVNAVYVELVKILRSKVAWPPPSILSGWPKANLLTDCSYRRDVGDTLINAYYILRNDMMGYYLNDIQERLASRPESNGWEEIEATLHCIMSVQEAVPLEDNQFIARLFGPNVLGCLPTTGQDRIRRTALSLTVRPHHRPPLLMNAISYIVAALPEPSLCLPAANALRDLCDANRAALAPHIGAFAELHAGLTGIPVSDVMVPLVFIFSVPASQDTEKSKVLQSIASVVQALPPEDEIPPVLAIVSPVVEKLEQALRSSSRLPEEARGVAIVQLQTLSGVAKGLTRTADSLLIIDETPAERAEAERLRRARDDYRMVELRESLFAAVRSAFELWSTDASVSDALSEFLRSVTSLPSDITLLSLPPGPLLELICIASQRQLTAVWLTLANMHIIQLDPPIMFTNSALKTPPNVEGMSVVSNALPVLLQTSLSMLGQPRAMESNPDIVQAFFGCLDSVAKHFVAVFYNLPPGALDALMQCAVSSLSLQERYSLVATCTFLETLIRRTAGSDGLGEAGTVLFQMHGRPILRAVLTGFAGVAPRSATQNLIELLSMIVSKYPSETREWMNEILFTEDFVQSKATPEAKRAFIKAVLGRLEDDGGRQQFYTLIARGLEGTSFGYASASM
ncbi:armadillo-type protein [Lanmaoa asiatica]|nr:armadillo-type protein [Lanmaoa asiatica]